MAINQLIAQGIRPIGADLPAIGQMLQQRKDAEQRNKLAELAAQTDAKNAEIYGQSLQAQTAAREAAMREQDATRAREWLTNAVTSVRQNPALIPVLVREGKQRGILTPETPDALTPEQVEEFALANGIAPRERVVPFEETPEAKAILLRGRVDAEADARRYRREMEIARLRQQPGPTALPNEATTTGAPKLPIGALKMVDEATQAINTSQETLALVSDAKSLVDTGAVNLGALKNAEAQGRNALGISDANSRAYASLQQTLEKLRNNYLLLAKGVQTEGDAQRAWDSEIGKNAQRDNKLASQQLEKAQRLTQLAIERQQRRIAGVYANYGAAVPQPAGGGGYLDQTTPTLPADVDAILKKYGNK